MLKTNCFKQKAKKKQTPPQYFLKRHLIDDFLKITYKENTYIKNTISKITVKCILSSSFLVHILLNYTGNFDFVTL